MMLGPPGKKNRNKKGLALGAAASELPGGSQAPLSAPPPKLNLGRIGASRTAAAAAAAGTDSASSASTATGGGASRSSHASSSSASSPSLPVPSSARNNYHDKLSEQLATLEVGLEFKLDLHAEDLELLGDLGAGNGGTVCKAVHVPTKLIMARKLVHIDAKPSVRRQILRELQIMHDCRSPYIVSFYGAYLQDPHICMCMEHMDKGSLDNIYKKTGAILEAVLGKIAVAVVSGLTYLYDAHRIIHRDVKPSNVLFNSQGQIKICDFGVSGELINSIADTFVGTSTYMSPERIQGSPYTVKSDVWSLGITLIELGLGRFPFAEADDSSDEDDDEFDDDDGEWTISIGDGEPTLSPSRPGHQAKTLEAAMVKREQRIQQRREEKSKAKLVAATSSSSNQSSSNNSKKKKKSKGGVSLEGGGAQMSILELLQHVVNEPAPRLTEGQFNVDSVAFVDSCLLKDHDSRPTPKQLMSSKWFTHAQGDDVDLVEWAKTIP